MWVFFLKHFFFLMNLAEKKTLPWMIFSLILNCLFLFSSSSRDSSFGSSECLGGKTAYANVVLKKDIISNSSLIVVCHSDGRIGRNDEFSGGETSRERGRLLFPGIQARRNPPRGEEAPNHRLRTHQRRRLNRASSGFRCRRAPGGPAALPAIQVVFSAVRTLLSLYCLQMGPPRGSESCVGPVPRRLEPTQGLRFPSPGHLRPQKVGPCIPAFLSSNFISMWSPPLLVSLNLWKWWRFLCVGSIRASQIKIVPWDWVFFDEL